MKVVVLISRRIGRGIKIMIEKLSELETWTDIQAESPFLFQNSNRHTGDAARYGDKSKN